MKRTLMLVIILLGAASAMAATGLGVGVKGGYAAREANFSGWTSSPGAMFNEELDSILIAGEVFYELNGEIVGLSPKHRFGIKAGYSQEGLADNSYFINPRSEYFWVEADNIPVIVYYKYAPRETGIHFWAGGGVSFASADWEYRDSVSGTLLEHNKKTEDKVIPRIDGGIEWRFWKYMGIGIDLAYLFGGEMEFDQDLQIIGGGRDEKPSLDLGGLNASVALRVYF